MRRGAAIAALAIVVLALTATVLFARPESAADRVDRLAGELRCPVCQGLSVRDSPSGTARAMHGVIAERVALGRTDAEIREEFRAAYGDWILLSPPVADLRGVVWLAPLLLLGAGLLFAFARLSAPPAPLGEPNPEQVARLRERARLEEVLDG